MNKPKKVIEFSLFKVVLLIVAIIFIVTICISKGDINNTIFSVQIRKLLGSESNNDTTGPTIMCPWTFGDVDDDLYVEEDDIELLEAVIAGTETLTDYEFYQADVNGDGELTQADVTAIRNYLDGNGTLPIGNRTEEVVSAYKVTESEIHIRTEMQDQESGLSKMIWYYKRSNASEYKTKEKNITPQGMNYRFAYEFYLEEIPQNTTYNIYFEIYDVAGNKTTSDVINVTTLEHEKPDIDDVEGPVLSPDTEGLPKNLNAYDVTESGFKVKISAQDELSGLSKMVWHWKKQSDAEYKTSEQIFDDAGTNLKKTITFTLDNLLSETSYNIYVDVYDVDGNKSTSDEITVTTLEAAEIEDVEGPTITSSAGVENKLSLVEVTNNTCKIAFYAKDELSGLNKYIIYYKKESDSSYMHSEKIADTQGSRSRTRMEFTLEGLTASTIYNVYVEVYDMAGNKNTSDVFLVGTLKDINTTPEVHSDVYEVVGLRIRGVSPKTKVSDFLNNIEITTQNFIILNDKDQELSETDYIGTNSRIKIDYDIDFSYQIQVTGDVNGDGNVGIQDLLAVNRHRLGKATLEGVYFEAGDINGDNAINIQDLLQINKARLGKIVL